MTEPNSLSRVERPSGKLVAKSQHKVQDMWSLKACLGCVDIKGSQRITLLRNAHSHQILGWGDSLKRMYVIIFVRLRCNHVSICRAPDEVLDSLARKSRWHSDRHTQARQGLLASHMPLFVQSSLTTTLLLILCLCMPVLMMPAAAVECSQPLGKFHVA